MSVAIHCDQVDCDTWCFESAKDELWLAVLGGAPNTDVAHFCSLDCLTKWAAANSEPTERISL